MRLNFILVVIGNGPHVWLLYLSRDDWFSTVGNGECSQIEVVFENDPYHSSQNTVCRCGVSLVYEQDMELMGDLNQANAQCSSSSRVLLVRSEEHTSELQSQ